MRFLQVSTQKKGSANNKCTLKKKTKLLSTHPFPRNLETDSSLHIGTSF